jgi:hypothetical protein
MEGPAWEREYIPESDVNECMTPRQDVAQENLKWARRIHPLRTIVSFRRSDMTSFTQTVFRVRKKEPSTRPICLANFRVLPHGRLWNPSRPVVAECKSLPNPISSLTSRDMKSLSRNVIDSESRMIPRHCWELFRLSTLNGFLQSNTLISPSNSIAAVPTLKWVRISFLFSGAASHFWRIFQNSHDYQSVQPRWTMECLNPIWRLIDSGNQWFSVPLRHVRERYKTGRLRLRFPRNRSNSWSE